MTTKIVMTDALFQAEVEAYIGPHCRDLGVFSHTLFSRRYQEAGGETIDHGLGRWQVTGQTIGYGSSLVEAAEAAEEALEKYYRDRCVANGGQA